MSDGIGSWLQCLSTLSQISIFANCAVVFFTSKRYRALMCDTGTWCENSAEDHGIRETHKLVSGWDLVDFLIFVLIVEHVIIVAKILLE